MKCSHCGVELESNASVCPFCGQAVPDVSRMQGQNVSKKLTKKEFLDLPEMKSYKKDITSCGIVLYILGGINIVVAIMSLMLPLDGIFLILFGLGIHLGKSRVCAILCAAFGVVNSIYLGITTGKLGGWFILLTGFYAVKGIFKFHSAWNKYQKDGKLPGTNMQQIISRIPD